MHVCFVLVPLRLQDMMCISIVTQFEIKKVKGKAIPVTGREGP
jgi:hypothetical protein